MSKFEIDIVNYFDREELVAEICFDRNQWAEISPNKGKMLVQFYAHPNKKCWEFSYEEAIKALEQAKDRLLKKSSQTESLFPEPPTDVEQTNKLGQEILEQIISHPQAIIYANRFGGKDIFEPSGRGARFDGEENFLGFLQLR